MRLLASLTLRNLGSSGLSTGLCSSLSSTPKSLAMGTSRAGSAAAAREAAATVSMARCTSSGACFFGAGVAGYGVGATGGSRGLRCRRDRGNRPW